MVRRALQIYLDSSDISRFTHPPSSQAAELREIETLLLTYQDEGKIQLRFSEAHVTEAAPTSKDAIPAAAARLGKIQELCGSHCLWHFFDIVSEEVRRQAAGQKLEPSEVQRDNGFWYPSLFEAEFLVSPEEFLGKFEYLGRKERREYLKDGRLTPSARQKFRHEIPAALRALAKGLPLGPAAVDILTKYYFGQIDRAAAEHAFRAALADLTAFARWYEVDSEAAMQFSSFLRDVGAEFKREIDKSRQDYSSLLAEAAEAQHSQHYVDQVMKSTFASTIQRVAIETAQSIAEDLHVSLDETKIVDPQSAFPGISSSTVLAMHVARRSVFGDSPRPAGASDFGDIYHAVYMPYVDIYRTDVFMASLINEAKLPTSTVLVRRLVDLPSAIDKALLG